MAIVTVSRGSLAAGQTVAEGVAARLGYRCVGSEELIAQATAHGVPPHEGARVIETAPSFWERLTISRDSYLAGLQLAMAELAAGDNVVYHGFAGQELLKDLSNMVKVRVIAPMDQRIASVMKAQNLNEKGAAEWIRRVDEDRLRRMRHLFGIDWRDAAHYDLVVNLAHMDVESAVEVIATVAVRPHFQDSDHSHKQMLDLLLASRVKAAICEQIGVTTIEVDADEGRVRLTGTIHGLEDEINDLIRIARGIEGVTAVDTDIRAQTLQEFTL